MHDRQWLQSSRGHDGPLHEVCRGRALHNCISRREVRSPNQYVDSETWLSDDGSIGQRNSFRGRTYERAHETFTGGSGSFHDIPSPEEWLKGKAESNVSVDAEGMLFQVHDRLGHISSTGDGTLQQHETLQKWS